MRRRLRSMPSGRVRGPWILASAALLALALTALASAAGEGGPLLAGKRNPSSNASRALTRETEVIADTSTYGTRQSNKSSNGGGAIYGCRSRSGGTEKGNEPCVRASNLTDGRAFEFSSGGPEVGRIASVSPAAAPFTTNAGGVATGLNADRLDGRSAEDLQTAVKFAAVAGSDGALAMGRGAKTSGRSAPGVYSVDFDADVSKCARTATITGADPGAITTTATDADTITVRTFAPAAATVPENHSFHLVVSC